MGLWYVPTDTGAFGTERIDLERQPCPTILAGGIKGRSTSQYWLEITMPRILVESSVGHEAAPGRKIGTLTHKFIDKTDAPMSTIISGCAVSLMVEESSAPLNHRRGPAKPPYRVPLMADIRAMPPNGLTVATTFAGGGGSSTGYRMAGCKVVWANEIGASARESYAANMAPDTVLDPRDIRKITAADILSATGLAEGELDVFDGSPPCFAAGTMILTRRGLVPIEDVRTGDAVVTHLGRWQTVTGTTKRRAAEIVAVRGHGHPGIRTTREHPFNVRHMTSQWDNDRRSYVRSFADQQWQGIGDCLPNGERGASAEAWFWGMLRTYPDDIVPDVMRSDIRSPLIQLSPEFFWIVGVWLGDGWLRTGKVHAKSDKQRGDVLICAAKQQAGEVRARIKAAELPFHEAEMRTTIRFTIHHAGLAEWLEEDFGRGARGKTIAAWAFGMPEDHRRALLDGYIFADGHRREGKDIRIGSVSWSLILGMAMIARTLGIATSLRSITRSATTTIENRVVNTEGAIYGLDLGERPRSFHVEADTCWGRIKELSVVGPGEVFNLHVEEDESYIADGLIVHNCVSFSTAGKREKGWGRVTASHDTVQRQDDLFLEYARLLKGLQPRAFVAENVSGLIKGTAKGYFLEILRALRACGYVVEAKLLDAQWLGVPQMRQRLIFVGIRSDLKAKPAFPVPLPYRYTVRDALPDVFGVRMITGNSAYETTWGSTANPHPTVMAGGPGKNGGSIEVIHDTAGKHSAGNISDTPSPTVMAGRQGTHFVQEQPAYIATYKNKRSIDTPARTIQTHGRNKTRNAQDIVKPSPTVIVEVPSGKITGTRLGHGFKPKSIGADEPMVAMTTRNQSAGNTFPRGDRKSVDNPSPSIQATEAGALGGAVTHELHTGTERRKFTIAELKRICGFPDDYILKGSYGDQWARCGNAVPPVMMKAIAEALLPILLRR